MQSTPSILLIEDDEDDFVLVRDLLLQAYGKALQLDWRASADDGLTAIAEGGHDIYLVDYRLDRQDGVQLVRRAIAAGCRAPMILLTGLASPTTDLQAKSAGAADYLVKDDLTAPLLERAIGHALSRQELSRVRTEADELLSRKNQKLAALYNTAHHFVGDLSNEFRTPLATVMDGATALREGQAGAVNEEQVRSLEIIIDRVQDLSIMVNDMLDMSRLEAGLIEVSRGANQVEEIFACVLPEFHRKAETLGCALRFDLQDNLPAVYCDFETIGRAVVNLIANAFKLAKDGQEIAIWARHDPSSQVVVVGVTDEGPGLSPGELEAIFLQFKQLEGRIRSSAKGFGLGLSVVKELVHLNFGEVWVESEAGEGSTFSFSIPTFDPVAIMVRYLSRVEYLRQGAPFVSLVDLSIAEPADALTLATFEQVLQPNVRRSDLLFRRSSGAWLLVAAASNLELEPLLQRLNEVWEREKPKRPDAHWPALVAEVKGCWSVPDQRQTVMTSFEREFPASQHAPESSEAGTKRGDEAPRHTAALAARKLASSEGQIATDS